MSIVNHVELVTEYLKDGYDSEVKGIDILAELQDSAVSDLVKKLLSAHSTASQEYLEALETVTSERGLEHDWISSETIEGMLQQATVVSHAIDNAVLKDIHILVTVSMMYSYLSDLYESLCIGLDAVKWADIKGVVEGRMIYLRKEHLKMMSLVTEFSDALAV